MLCILIRPSSSTTGNGDDGVRGVVSAEDDAGGVSKLRVMGSDKFRIDYSSAKTCVLL